MSRPLRMGTAALVVSASILLSRVLGLGREVLLATLIGANFEGDLYRLAFTIPDFLNYLLAGAYLTITLIPILSRHLEGGDLEAAARAFTSVFRFVAIAVVALTAVMWVFADSLVGLIFPEVVDHDRLVALTRLVLPAQVFLVMGSLLMAVQYTHRRFVFPALAPLIYNLGIIVGGLVGWLIDEPSPEAFLWGAVIGSAVGNFGLQWLGARRTGTWLTSITSGDSAVREYLVLALPLMLGQSIIALDEQFVRFFGHVEEAATSWLSFARQLNMVSIGVIAQAAGVAAFPFLARLAARGDNEGLNRTATRAARLTVYVAVLAAAIMVATAKPLVRILFQYREFTEADTTIVAGLLAIYALSIPAWGVQQVLARYFYSKRQMWLPVLIGTVFTLLAIPLWIWLRDLRGVTGMAMASVIGISGYAITLGIVWGRQSGPGWGRSLASTMARCALVGAAAGFIGREMVGAILGQGSIDIGPSILAIMVGSVAVIGIYLVGTFAMRSPELREIRRRGGDDVTALPE